MRALKTMLLVGASILYTHAFAQSPGSAGLGEPFYPWMGNGGYDVQDYDASLRMTTDFNIEEGSVTIEAVATQDLSAFNLDFGQLRVTAVNVNGLEARFVHRDPELTITPKNPIRSGDRFRVRVNYKGLAGSRAFVPGMDLTAWNRAFNLLIVMAEPSRLLDWMPSNDHPTDKATFTLRLTAPKEFTIAAGGTLVSQQNNADATRSSTFRYATPTTTYGVLIALGDQRLETADPVGKVQIRHYLSPATSDQMRRAVAQSGAMIQFFEARLGPYPFTEFGVLTHQVEAAYGLETQSLVSLPANWRNPSQESNTEVVAHELAHQWFGMMVTLRDYRDIWLHEGFAQYLGWLYSASVSKNFTLEAEISADYPSAVQQRYTHSFTKADFLELLRENYDRYSFPDLAVGRALDLLFGSTLSAAARAKIVMKGRNGLSATEFAAELEELNFTRLTVLYKNFDKFRNLLTGSDRMITDDRYIAPGRVTSSEVVFNSGVYDRGAMALYVLQQRMGDEAFWSLLREYLEKYKFSNASLQDFLELTKARAGTETETVLEAWLFSDELPDLPNLKLFAKDYKLGADLK
jgi:aminopeptidase N